MDRQTLFIRTLEDIEERSKSQDAYTIIGISGLVRKLFLEKHPLFDTVNQRYRDKPKFSVGLGFEPRAEDLPLGSLWYQQDGLDPDTAPPGTPIKILGRREFFQHVVSVTSGQRYTIKDVIRYQAHVTGGVHAGKPENIKEHVMQNIDSLFLIGGHEMGTRQLLAIARIVLKAL